MNNNIADADLLDFDKSSVTNLPEFIRALRNCFNAAERMQGDIADFTDQLRISPNEIAERGDALGKGNVDAQRVVREKIQPFIETIPGQFRGYIDKAIQGVAQEDRTLFLERTDILSARLERALEPLVELADRIDQAAPDNVTIQDIDALDSPLRRLRRSK